MNKHTSNSKSELTTAEALTPTRRGVITSATGSLLAVSVGVPPASPPPAGALLDRLRESVMEGIPDAHAHFRAGRPNETEAYANMIFALGHAAIGDPRPHILHAGAEALDVADPTHGFLVERFLARAVELLGGCASPIGDLPTGERLWAYKVRRLCEVSALLHPQRCIKAYHSFHRVPVASQMPVVAAEDQLLRALSGAGDVDAAVQHLIVELQGDASDVDPVRVVVSMMSAGRNPAPLLRAYRDRTESPSARLKATTAVRITGATSDDFASVLSEERCRLREAWWAPDLKGVKAVAEAAAVLPEPCAMEVWDELAGHVPRARDYYCTQGHFGLGVLTVVSAVVEGVVLADRLGQIPSGGQNA